MIKSRRTCCDLSEVKRECFPGALKKDPDRKPLIVREPRQVGKTEFIRRFATRHYENVIEINFMEEPNIK